MTEGLPGVIERFVLAWERIIEDEVWGWGGMGLVIDRGFWGFIEGCWDLRSITENFKFDGRPIILLVIKIFLSKIFPSSSLIIEFENKCDLFLSALFWTIK